MSRRGVTSLHRKISALAWPRLGMDLTLAGTVYIFKSRYFSVPTAKG